jgi:hypothetical protein
MTAMSKRLTWAPILIRAIEIVESYATSVTLRQLFYRLVAENFLPNLRSYYQRLSSYSAEGRRNGTFPELLDRKSTIEQPASFASPEDAKQFLRDLYRRDRTEGQKWTILLGVEKAGISAQLEDWFTDPLGIPHVAWGGYASQTLVDMVRRYVEGKGRPAVLIYAGDLDPSGEDIDRDFIERTGCFAETVRVGLNEDQVSEYRLMQNFLDPEVMEKLKKDPRKKRFIERHGSLMQYELDGIDPNTLRDLYRSALADYWNERTYKQVLKREEQEKKQL